MTYPAAVVPLGFPNCAACPFLRSGPVAVCIACAMSTVPKPPTRRCPTCSQALTGDPCRNSLCKDPSRGFGTVAAISTFTEPLAHVIRNYKYLAQARGWATILGRLVLGWLDANEHWARRYDVIVANPGFVGRFPFQHIETMLEAARTEDLRQRWPINPYALSKPIATERSASRGTTYPTKARCATLHASAIVVGVPVLGKSVLMVDDMFTTGLQMSEVGKRLLGVGASRVDGLVVARVPWSG